MNLMKTPGVPLFLVGAAVFFIVGPLAGGIPILGAVITPIAFVGGILGMGGGGYLAARSKFGPKLGPGS